MGTASESMLEMLMNNARWSFIVRGVLAIAFGIFMLIWPLRTLAVLILLFGIFAIANGFVALIGAFQSGRERQDRWLHAIYGVFSILTGIAAFVWPGRTALTFLVIIAIWAIVTGILEIAAAFPLRQAGADTWLLVASGAISLLFGIFLLLSPQIGLLTLVWVIGVYAIIYGVLMLTRASLLHSLVKSTRTDIPPG